MAGFEGVVWAPKQMQYGIHSGTFRIVDGDAKVLLACATNRSTLCLIKTTGNADMEVVLDLTPTLVQHVQNWCEAKQNEETKTSKQP